METDKNRVLVSKSKCFYFVRGGGSSVSPPLSFLLVACLPLCRFLDLTGWSWNWYTSSQKKSIWGFMFVRVYYKYQKIAFSQPLSINFKIWRKYGHFLFCLGTRSPGHSGTGHSVAPSAALVLAINSKNIDGHERSGDRAKYLGCKCKDCLVRIEGDGLKGISYSVQVFNI